jgi:hypothetical protein
MIRRESSLDCGKVGETDLSTFCVPAGPATRHPAGKMSGAILPRRISFDKVGVGRTIKVRCRDSNRMVRSWLKETVVKNGIYGSNPCCAYTCLVCAGSHMHYFAAELRIQSKRLRGNSPSMEIKASSTRLSWCTRSAPRKRSCSSIARAYTCHSWAKPIWPAERMRWAKYCRMPLSAIRSSRTCST